VRGETGHQCSDLVVGQRGCFGNKSEWPHKAEAETNQNRMFYFLRRFVETYYPELKEAVSFERPTEKKSSIANSLEQFSQRRKKAFLNGINIWDARKKKGNVPKKVRLRAPPRNPCNKGDY
jgi:hypothetical protein